MRRARLPLAMAIVGVAVVGCDTAAESESSDRPTVAVATNILADVAEHAVGEHVDVLDLMPRGADPHSYEISAAEAEEVFAADLLVLNGYDFEEGLAAVVNGAQAEGVPVREVAREVDPLPYGDVDMENGEDDASGSLDPHFFTDPLRMADVPDLLADWIAEVAPDVDADALRADAEAYADELRQLHDDIAETLAVVPDPDRRLVTNHHVFNYFADRYDFTVVGTVVPSGTTLASPSAADLADLASTIEDTQVPAIFVDVGSTDALARALAEEVNIEVDIIDLYTETLGADGTEASSYEGTVRGNAERIAAALGP